MLNGANDVMISMSPSAFAGATTAIGLLAGFRLNASYGRVKEGRKAWSDVNTATRNLAGQTLMWVRHFPHAQARILRLCQAFPITLLFHLNAKGCHHNMKRKSKRGEASFEERVQAEFDVELQDVYHSVDSNDKDSSNDNQQEYNSMLHADFERLSQTKARGGNVPLEVISCLRETLSALSEQDERYIKALYIKELEVRVQTLTQALGFGERVLKTPLPTGFTRHSSRLLFVWSNCLPLAVYPLVGPLGTLPASLLTSYAILGLEDISVQLEEPFDILPLRQYSDGMFDSIQEMESSFTPYAIDNETSQVDNDAKSEGTIS